MKLYPRLPLGVASHIASELRARSIAELRESSACEHDSQIYAPTGGSRVGKSEIAALQNTVRAIADQCGYPAIETENARRTFDREGTVFLHSQMDIGLSEASKVEVWSFLTCVVVPDLVRWRFGGVSGTTEERFLGGARGLRNALGRLWWRGFTFIDSSTTDQYELAKALGEDELVQIMERPAIAGNRRLARTLAKLLLSSSDSAIGSRSAVLRDATKRVRRLLAFTVLDVLPDPDLDALLGPLFGIRPDGGPPLPGTSPGTHADLPREFWEYLSETGLEKVDNRPLGGPLWVVADEQTGAPLAGWGFKFTARGGRATDFEPGWYFLPDRGRTAQQPVVGTLQSVGLRFAKMLSPNDVGETGAHQAGIAVPKSEASFFPSLDRELLNPSVWLDITDESGRLWRWRYVHYNNGVVAAGTRDEYRLTNVTEYLRARGAVAGNWLELERTGPRTYRVTLVNEPGQTR